MDFDYNSAIQELETIAEKVEDSSTAISDIEKYLKRASELIKSCRAYLRTNREKLNSFE